MRVETFSTPGPVQLDVRVPAGSVTIATVDGEETRVELESVDGDASVEDEAVVEERDGRVTVALEERRILFVKTAPQVRVRISCPHDAELSVKTVAADVDGREARLRSAEVKTVSGDVRLERVAGDVELKTVSGDARVGDVAGGATAQTVSGEVALRRVDGAVEVRTVSGDVRVDEAATAVTGQTVSGDLLVRSVAQGKVALKTVSGDVLVGIRSGSALWVDAKSVGGDTSSELPLGDAPPSRDAPLVELQATAMSGDIKIVRA